MSETVKIVSLDQLPEEDQIILTSYIPGLPNAWKNVYSSAHYLLKGSYHSSHQTPTEILGGDITMHELPSNQENPTPLSTTKESITQQAETPKLTQPQTKYYLNEEGRLSTHEPENEPLDVLVKHHFKINWNIDLDNIPKIDYQNLVKTHPRFLTSDKQLVHLAILGKDADINLALTDTLTQAYLMSLCLVSTLDTVPALTTWKKLDSSFQESIITSFHNLIEAGKQESVMGLLYADSGLLNNPQSIKAHSILKVYYDSVGI